MQKQNNKRLILNLQIFAMSAILAAFSVVFGKYLAINIGESIRFSFENLPILLAGLYFGPLYGGAVGLTADLVGCLLVGYAINPIITLGAASIGIISGIVGKVVKKNGLFRILPAIVFSHFLGSVVIKTIGMAVFFQLPFWVTFGWRCVNYLIIGTAEGILLYLLSRSCAFTEQMQRYRRK